MYAVHISDDIRTQSAIQREKLYENAKVVIRFENKIKSIESILHNNPTLINEAEKIASNYCYGYKDYYEHQIIKPLKNCESTEDFNTIIRHKRLIISKDKELRRIEEEKQKVRTLQTTYRKGYEYYLNHGCYTSTSPLQVILQYEDYIKNKDREIENQERIERQKREERERIRRQQEEEKRKHNELIRLRNKISSWETTNNGVRCYFMRYYYPVNSFGYNVDNDEKNTRELIWGFKDGQLSKRNQIIKDTKKVLSHFFGQDVNMLTFVCIVASSQDKTETRYKDFAETLCDDLNMDNAFPHIKVTTSGVARHEGGDGEKTITYSSGYFSGKYVILFDDLTSSGRSISEFKKFIEDSGGHVLGAITIGKTVHSNHGTHPINYI